jgi:hypothetical protein
MPCYVDGCYGETMEEALAAASKQAAARRAKAAATLEKHQPEVVKIEKDGKTVHVRFTRNNGDRVIGTYTLTSWAWPPAEEMRKLNEALADPGWGRGPKKGSKRRRQAQGRTRPPSVPEVLPPAPDRA